MSVRVPLMVFLASDDARLIVRLLGAEIRALERGPTELPGDRDYLAQLRSCRAVLATARDEVVARTQPDLRPDFRRLTPRERQVTLMIAEGRTNKAMALALGISPRTVEVHRAHIFRKLGVAGATGLVRAVLEAGEAATREPPAPSRADDEAELLRRTEAARLAANRRRRARIYDPMPATLPLPV